MFVVDSEVSFTSDAEVHWKCKWLKRWSGSFINWERGGWEYVCLAVIIPRAASKDPLILFSSPATNGTTTLKHSEDNVTLLEGPHKRLSSWCVCVFHLNYDVDRSLIRSSLCPKGCCVSLSRVVVAVEISDWISLSGLYGGSFPITTLW